MANDIQVTSPEDRVLSLSSLSENELEKMQKLIEDQYVPEENTESEENATDDENNSDSWRERNSTHYPYLVRGAYLACNEGSHHRKLNLPWSHGFYMGGNMETPLLNATDCKPGEGEGFNIPPFGICKSKRCPREGGKILLKSETINPITGEAYRDANGNIEKIDENVRGYPCKAMIVDCWQNTHPDTLIGLKGETARGALTVGSFLVCLYEGVIEPISTGQPQLDPPKMEPKKAQLPPKFQLKVDRILENSSLSTTEKADKVVAVYENYLLSLAPEAFAKYNENRLKFLGIEGKMRQTEAKLGEALQNLNLDITALLNNMGDDLLRAVGKAQDKTPAEKTLQETLVNPVVLDLMEFKTLVDAGAPLDLKSREIGATAGNDYDWSIWTCQWGGTGAGESRQDYTGNYLYGYFGSGYFEHETFLDDTDFIQDGITMYKRNHGGG